MRSEVIVGVIGPAAVSIVNSSASVQPRAAQVHDGLAGAVARQLGLGAVRVEDPKVGRPSRGPRSSTAAGRRRSRSRSAGRRSRLMRGAVSSQGRLLCLEDHVVVAEGRPLLERRSPVVRSQERDYFARHVGVLAPGAVDLGGRRCIFRIQVSWRRAYCHWAVRIAASSPSSSSSKPIAARAVRDAPAASALRDLLGGALARPSASTRASMRARSSSRSVVRPTSTVGPPQPLAPELARRARPLDPARGEARSASRSASRRAGARSRRGRPASSACSASGPRSAISASTSSRIAGGYRRAQLELRERRAHVEARPADQDRPAALGQQPVDLGVRALGEAPGRELLGDGDERRPAGARAARAPRRSPRR